MNVIAQTLLSPDKITRKRSFHDYENVRSTSHNIPFRTYLAVSARYYMNSYMYSYRS